jgi:hypothetical protein
MSSLEHSGAETFADRPVAEASSSDVAGSDAAGADAAGADAASSEGLVNFDEAALVELELDETDYRLDAGRAGTALCISTRPSGTWSWTFRGEARWQNNVLRCKAFDRVVLTRLSQALVEVSSAAD